MKGIRIELDDIVKMAQNDPRVQLDNEKADQLKKEGGIPCERCEGTGNEFLFMYRQCSDCLGTGVRTVSKEIN